VTIRPSHHNNFRLAIQKRALNASLRSAFRNRPAHLVGGDFSKSNNDVSVIRDNERLGAFAELARAFCGEQHELKTTGDFIQTIFNCYSCHRSQ